VDPNISDITLGFSALHYASANGQIPAIKLLLEYGADVDAQSTTGEGTPLLCATATEGHLEVVRLLLDHGADANARKKYGWTALHLAAKLGHLQFLEVLLRRGADPYAQTDAGETALQLSSEKHMRIAQLLSERTRAGM
jgi:ankyrin repeat protein